MIAFQNILNRLQQREVMIGLGVVVAIVIVWWFFLRGKDDKTSLANPPLDNPALTNPVSPYPLDQYFPEPQTAPVSMQGGGSDKDLVLYYAPWCGHCKSLTPTWTQLAEKYNGSVVGSDRVTVRKVNADENPEETRDLEIEGFPTIIMFKEDQKIPYEGDRSLESLEAFLKQ